MSGASTVHARTNLSKVLAQTPNRPLTLSELQIRLRMLEDFQIYLLRASRDLSTLAHSL
jgi:hypothetical protein